MNRKTSLSHKIGRVALAALLLAWQTVTPAAAQFGLFNRGQFQIEYLVVGGGAGSSQGAGGGGEVKSGTAYVAAGVALSITPGAAGPGSVSASTRGSNGGDSSIGAPLSVTSKGGRGGGAYLIAGGAGPCTGVDASAGEGAGGGGTQVAGGCAGGSGTHAGGNGGYNGTGIGAGGGSGGGCGSGTSATFDGIDWTSGSAGAGCSSSITGTSVTYATGSCGGSGYMNGTCGNANPGSGAAGCSGIPCSAGHDGIVVVRYLGPQRATGCTVSSSGGYTIHSCTSNTTITFN